MTTTEPQEMETFTLVPAIEVLLLNIRKIVRNINRKDFFIELALMKLSGSLLNIALSNISDDRFKNPSTLNRA